MLVCPLSRMWEAALLAVPMTTTQVRVNIYRQIEYMVLNNWGLHGENLQDRNLKMQIGYRLFPHPVQF